MKYKKLVVPDATPRVTSSRTMCDGCGLDVQRLSKSNGDGNSDEVEIKAVLGDVWPEGDFREVQEFDICVECWKTIVCPLLEAKGFKLRKHDVEGYRDVYRSYAWDPELYPNGPPPGSPES